MKNLIYGCLILAFTGTSMAQSKIEKRLPVNKANLVSLDFKFADEVKIETWNENEVALSASILIDDGEHDGLYEIMAEVNGNELKFYSDTEKLEKVWKNKNWKDDCCRYGVQMDVAITVKMPATLDLDFNSISGNIEVPEMSGVLDLNTISGDITVKPTANQFRLKTISGDLELLIDKPISADIEVNTISGEIYSNLESLEIANKDGLRQLVGQKIRGKIDVGGENWELETISGDIFLRQLY